MRDSKDPFYNAVTGDPLQTRIASGEDRMLGTIERTDTHNPVKGHAEAYNHFFDEMGRLRKVDIPDIVRTPPPPDPPTDLGADQASVSIEYNYDKTGQMVSVTVTSLRAGEGIYYVGYEYDANGRMTSRLVKIEPTDTGWLNWATFKYDGRGQLLDEKYTYSNGTTTSTVYQGTNAYDLGGNLTARTMKRLEATILVTYTFSNFSYSKSHQLRQFDVADNKTPSTSTTYTAQYDVRGNLLNFQVNFTPPTGIAPFNFPSFTYNNLNDIVSYTSGGTTQYLWRDPMGRVFRKANYSGIQGDPATHYYYTFDALAQEYDFYLDGGTLHNDLDFDYLRRFNGKVLRQRDIDATSKDRQPVQDVLGSPLNLINGDTATMSGSTSGYTFDAWGQSFTAGNGQAQPQETNHVRYHGAFTEEFVSSGDTDGIYRMGARHYSTVLGRFLQKEPLNLAGSPSVFYPLSSNDYIYCGNSPTTSTDITGLDSMNMGILYPPEKPGPATPDEPLPDPDPYFDPHYKPGGQKPDKILPGAPSGFLPQFPWWDRRTPSIPSAGGLSGGPLMGMSSGPVGPLPILPLRPLPILPMPIPSDKLPPSIFPIKGDWLSGDALLPQGYKDNHFVVTKSISVSMNSGAGSGSGGGHFRMPNYGFVRMAPSYGSGKEQVQSKADFNKNFWKQEGWDIVGKVAKWTAIAVGVAIGVTFIAAALGSEFALGMIASDPVIGALINLSEDLFGETTVNRTLGYISRKFWDRGTFGSATESMMYHLGKHGAGRNILKYTLDALNWARRNQSVLKFVRPTQEGYQAAWYFRYLLSDSGGYFTTAGKILSFWGV